MFSLERTLKMFSYKTNNDKTNLNFHKKKIKIRNETTVMRILDNLLIFYKWFDTLLCFLFLVVQTIIFLIDTKQFN